MNQSQRPNMTKGHASTPCPPRFSLSTTHNFDLTAYCVLLGHLFLVTLHWSHRCTEQRRETKEQTKHGTTIQDLQAYVPQTVPKCLKSSLSPSLHSRDLAARLSPGDLGRDLAFCAACTESKHLAKLYSRRLGLALLSLSLQGVQDGLSMSLIPC